VKLEEVQNSFPELVLLWNRRRQFFTKNERQ